jgi:glycosyltransferase involved in cell wall biosynthesis
VNPEEIAAVRTGDFDKIAVRERLGIALDDFVVLSVGQFVDRKGRWTLLDAAKHIVDAATGVVFVWVMPDEASDEDKKRIESFGLGRRFVPVLSSSIGNDRDSILKFFQIGDTFVLPSFVEGLPIALLEAMALEIPSISTNVYAIPEAIIHEETGILIEAGDSVALTASILRMRQDVEFRERLAKSGSSFVLEHFDEKDAASLCIAAYRRCFESR